MYNSERFFAYYTHTPVIYKFNNQLKSVGNFVRVRLFSFKFQWILGNAYYTICKTNDVYICRI